VPRQRFRIVDHTGDLAVRLWGNDPPDLLRSAGLALTRILAPEARVRASRSYPITAGGADLAEILIGWMNRLLLVHHLQQALFCEFDVGPVSGGTVVGTAHGEPIDRERHGTLIEIKAATYHDVRIRRDDRGRWTTRVVLDV